MITYRASCAFNNFNRLSVSTFQQFLGHLAGFAEHHLKPLRGCQGQQPIQLRPQFPPLILLIRRDFYDFPFHDVLQNIILCVSESIGFKSFRRLQSSLLRNFTSFVNQGVAIHGEATKICEVSETSQVWQAFSRSFPRSAWERISEWKYHLNPATARINIILISVKNRFV